MKNVIVLIVVAAGLASAFAVARPSGQVASGPAAAAPVMRIEQGVQFANYGDTGFTLNLAVPRPGSERTVTKPVPFDPPFARAPRVLVALKGVQFDTSGTDSRLPNIDVRAKNVTRTGFEVEFMTNGNGLTRAVEASWLAIAP